MIMRIVGTTAVLIPSKYIYLRFPDYKLNSALLNRDPFENLEFVECDNGDCGL